MVFDAIGVVLAFAMTGSGPSPLRVEPVQLDRAGSIRVGEALSQLQAKANWKTTDASDAEWCEYYSGDPLPEGVSMMVEQGRVTRFDLSGAGTGPFGIRIGDSEDAALHRLPSGTERGPHFYGEKDDHYLTWKKPGTDLAARVETMDGKVTVMYWGKWKSVQYVEGCQ